MATAIDPSILNQYATKYGTIGAITMRPGVEGGDDTWWTADGRMADPYWGGVFDTQQFAGQTPTQFTLFGQSGIDPDGTPARGGIKGIYNAQGQLQGDPWYQQPTNTDWSGLAIPAMALAAAYAPAMFGADAAGGAGWTSGYDLAGGGSLSGMGAADAASIAAAENGILGSTVGQGAGATAAQQAAANAAIAGVGAAVPPPAAASGLPFGLTAGQVAAGVGAIAGLTTDKNPTASSTSTNDAPAWAQPYATDILQRGQALANQPAPTYTGANPYSLTPQQTSAMNTAQSAMDQFGQATAPAADYMNSVLAGQQQFNPQSISGITNGYVGQTTPGASNPFIGLTSPGAANGYIGATSPGSAGVGSVANKLYGLAMQDNPFLGASTQQASATTAQQAGRNSLLGLNNPYLNNAISQAQGDVTRQYNLTTAPQLDAQMHASGSYGNTGVQQMQQEAQRNLAQELGRVDSNMRMQDYGLQAQLGEGQAGREQATNLANAGYANAASQFNAGLSANDLARNVSGFNTQQGQRLSALGGAYSQDANLGQQNNQFNANLAYGDLGRNAQLAQNQGQFNSTLGQADIARNAQLYGQQGQFNASLGQADLTRNANLAQQTAATNADIQGRNATNAQTAWTGNQSLMSGMLNPYLNYANNPVNQAQALFGMGTTAGQAGANNGLFNYGLWQGQQQWAPQQLQTYGNLYGSTVRGGTTNTTQQVPGSNPLGTAIGTGLAAYSLLNQPQQNNIIRYGQ